MLGTHLILEMFDCPTAKLDDLGFIEQAITEACLKGRLTLLHLKSHKFTPHGITAVGLLAKSHISFHSWPENGYAAVDIFTCGNRADTEVAGNYLVKLFESERYSRMILSRGRPGLHPVVVNISEHLPD